MHFFFFYSLLQQRKKEKNLPLKKSCKNEWMGWLCTTITINLFVNGNHKLIDDLGSPKLLGMTKL